MWHHWQLDWCIRSRHVRRSVCTMKTKPSRYETPLKESDPIRMHYYQPNNSTEESTQNVCYDSTNLSSCLTYNSECPSTMKLYWTIEVPMVQCSVLKGVLFFFVEFMKNQFSRKMIYSYELANVSTVIPQLVDVSLLSSIKVQACTPFRYIIKSTIFSHGYID